MAMLIFLDTEFTRLPPPMSEGYRARPRLISLALVSEGGQEFYAELSDGWSISECSDFVKREVLPSLGKVRDALCPRDELDQRLQAWFQSLAEPTKVVYDFHVDWDLLNSVFSERLPPNIVDRLLLGREILDSSVYLQARKLTYTNDWPPHHALADAQAIKNGYLAWAHTCDPR